MSDLGQDSVNLFGPNEWVRIRVVYSNELFNGGDKIRCAAERATSNTLAGDLPKPSFNKIEPRGRSRREAAMKAWMLFQPCLDPGVIVRAIVVQDHMDRQAFGSFTVNLPQKLPEFDVAMPRITRADDIPFQHIQRREQASSAVTLVIARHRPAATFLHRQARLRPVKRPYLRLFVHAQNNGLVGGVQAYARHIRQLFNKPLVFGEFEPLCNRQCHRS